MSLLDEAPYLKRYGLREPPYSTKPNERYLYLTPIHQEAIAMAAKVIRDREGAALIYGKFGTGKTTLMAACTPSCATCRRKCGSGSSRMPLIARRSSSLPGKLQRLIDDYNAGSRNVESLFDALVELAQGLNEEEQRGIVEQLTEEELALFDLLTRPGPDLTQNEVDQVKKVARDLLDTLKAERLVLDWRTRQQTRAGVEQSIRETLDRLPPQYDMLLYERKCEAVYQHIYESCYDDGWSVYTMAT